MFCYSDSGPRAQTAVNVWNMNATKAYLRHFENFLFLDFILNNGDYNERQQARKELTICERKMRFWEKHPNFEALTVQREKEKLLVSWKTGDRPDFSTVLRKPARKTP